MKKLTLKYIFMLQKAKILKYYGLSSSGDVKF